MNITQFGRVEIDPMLIPTSSVGEQDSGVSFERTLEQTVEQQDAAHESRPRAESDTEAQLDAEPQEAPDGQPESEQKSEADTPAEKGTQSSTPTEAMPREGDEKAKTKTLEAGAPVRRDTAGKGTGAPASHFSEIDSGKNAANPNGESTSIGFLGSVAPISTSSTTTNGARPTSGAFEELNATLRFNKTSAAAGYRSTTKQALELAEAARDSVFKQIAMNLTPEGGEMVMLLDPPELGKLDIHLVVENGNIARLVIGAERPELAALLEKHMSELRDHLESLGITVGSAEVHAREQTDRGHKQNGKEGSDSPEQDDASTDPWARVRDNPGFITADGLEIWV